MCALFSGKGKYSCLLTDCCMLAQLDCALPEYNFLSTGLKTTTAGHNDAQGENVVHQSQILRIVYAQMCVIGNTGFSLHGLSTFNIHVWSVF